MTTSTADQHGYDPNHIQLDEPTLHELTRRMAKLGVQTTSPRVGQPTIRSPVVRRNQIIHALLRYNVLLGQHLSDLFYADLAPGGAIRALQRDLQPLLDEGWVVGSRYPDRNDSLYQAGRWSQVLQAVAGRKRWGDRRLRWAHDLLVADFMTTLVSDSRHQSGTAEWWGEYESWLPNEVRPDAIGSYTLSNLRLDFFLEADTGSEGERIIGQKFEQYLSYYHEGNWRAGFSRESYPAVLVVTSAGEGRLHNMVGAVSSRMAAEGVPLPWFFTTEARLVEARKDAGSLGALHQPLWFDADDQAGAVWSI